MNQKRGQNQPYPQDLTRREFLKLGGALLGVYLLSSCSPDPTTTPEPTPILPTDTSLPPTRTPTEVPPTSTPRPTSTEKPTQTPTQTPTETPVPKIDVLKLLDEVGVEFPENFQTHLERDYGEFNFRLSQELFGKFNLPTAHLQEDVSESFYLQAMGRYMSAARWVDEKRYADFFELADRYFKRQAGFFSGNPEDQDFQYEEGGSEYQELAKKRLQEDCRVPLDFGPEENDIKGEIKYVGNLNMNFVTQEEYLKVKGKLKDAGIKYFQSTNWYAEKNSITPAGRETTLFINGDNIEIICCNLGFDWVPVLKPGASSMRWGSPPPEKLSPGFGANWYYNSLITLYKGALSLSLRNLSTDEKARKFGNDKEYFEESEITHYIPPNRCGMILADNFEIYKKYEPVCAQVVENTFSLTP